MYYTYPSVSMKSVVLLLIIFSLGISCKLTEIEIDFKTNTTGTFAYRHMVTQEALTILDLDGDGITEAVFPFYTDDFRLLAQLIDGIEIETAESIRDGNGNLHLTAIYNFTSFVALAEVIAYMGLEMNSTKLGKQRELTIQGKRTQIPEVDQVDNIKEGSRLVHWQQLRFAKLLFPDLKMTYKIKVPDDIVRTNRGQKSGKTVELTESISEISDNPANFVWRIRW